MPSALLTRHTHHTRPTLTVLGDAVLTLSRCHEICGPARRSFALMAAARTTGPVIWIRPGWVPEQLNPDGVVNWINPGRLLTVNARRAEDLLWSMEEVLRSGAVALVVTDLPAPPGLTPVRRLHLAAETGTAEGSHAPLGLVLTPGDGGAAGVESRWHIAPRHAPSRTGWQLERRRARNAAPAIWQLEQSSGDKDLTITPGASHTQM
ncbi:MAG: hypothetical protein HKP40_05300 [Litoreibacter sp.]|nr:hypothetical protein [Litoreibacter sp.]